MDGVVPNEPVIGSKNGRCSRSVTSKLTVTFLARTLQYMLHDFDIPKPEAFITRIHHSYWLQWLLMGFSAPLTQLSCSKI
jgi:hypothetical protein